MQIIQETEFSDKERMDKICKVFISLILLNVCFSYFCIHLNMLLSFDTPYSGSGDHENYFGMNQINFVAYDENGKEYGNCIKKAVDIREIEIHRPWFSFGNYSLFFSDLTTQRFVHLTEENFEQALIEAKQSIRYTKAVNASFGYENNF